MSPSLKTGPMVLAPTPVLSVVWGDSAAQLARHRADPLPMGWELQPRRHGKRRREMADTAGTSIMAMAVTPLGTGCLYGVGSSGVAVPVATLAGITGPYCHKSHVSTISAPLAWRDQSSESHRPLKGLLKSFLLLPFPPSKAQMGVGGKGRTQPPCRWDTSSKGSPISAPGQRGNGAGHEVPLLTISG